MLNTKTKTASKSGQRQIYNRSDYRTGHFGHLRTGLHNKISQHLHCSKAIRRHNAYHVNYLHEGQLIDIITMSHSTMSNLFVFSLNLRYPPLLGLFTQIIELYTSRLHARISI